MTSEQTALAYLDGIMERSPEDSPVWQVERAREGKPARWDYVDGCVFKACLDIYDATGDERYFTFAERRVGAFVNADGSIKTYALNDYNCDQINEGKTLFRLYDKTGETRYRKAADLLRKQLMWQPRTPNGNFWHKLAYPYQIWLDGLYMAQPFAAEYEKRFGGGDFSDTLRQFANVSSQMRDSGGTGLFHHAWDVSGEMFWCGANGLSPKNFWLRSMGWYGMALIDVYDIIGGNADLARDLSGLTSALLNYADADGLLRQVVNYPNAAGNYAETSGSAAVAYCLMKGARLGALPNDCFDKGRTMFDALVKHKLVEENGVLTLKDICLVSGLGGMKGKGDYETRDGSLAYYLSEPRVNDDGKGLAALTFACSEVLLKQ